MPTRPYRTAAFRQQFEIASPFLDQPGFALWDANILWRSHDNRYELGIHAKNITNKKYVVGGYSYLLGNAVTGGLTFGSNGLPIPSLGKTGVATGFYGPPREVFLSAGVNF